MFRSKLTDQAREDYQAMNAELEILVRQNPGFVDVKSYTAADGERLTVVWWRDEALSDRVEKLDAPSRSAEYRPPKMV